MDATSLLAQHLKHYTAPIGKVVDMNSVDRLFAMNLTLNNSELSTQLLNQPEAFDAWVTDKLRTTGSRYGVGGYMENRAIYTAREHFSDRGEARSIHLGIDIWGAAGTTVYTPLDGTVHSFQDNAGYGDYGPTIIIQHNIAGLILYSLYGHLSSADLTGLAIGQHITAGQQIARFGALTENGNWPPHLHFQLMLDMQGLSGDYPGVCKPSEKEKYLQKIPNPNLLLQFNM
ncbi:MAG: peptidase M23 [Sphingobacteriaceae bacterium]|nr:MAG: peptidase M23 [Sphingobacteriaceae bacterium]